MALMKCYECGHNVSTTARMCPNCGAPTKQERPPPIPTGIPSNPPPVPAALAAAPTSEVRLRSKDQKFLRLVLVPGMGLVGVFLDVYVAGTIFTALARIRSDYNQFAVEHPFLAQIFSTFLQDQGASKAVEQFEAAGFILVICALVGTLASVLFLAHRFSKALGVALIVCGIGPMLHHPIEFFGLPMALGGVLGLFVRDKLRSPA